MRTPTPLLIAAFLLATAPARGTNDIAYVLVDLESGKIEATQNPSRPLPPASVAKIATAYYALSILGHDRRFETELGYTGNIHDGVLSGDLYLRGDGDPFLTAAQLASLATQVARLGIRKIDGHFYYDETALSGSAIIDPKGELDQTFNPGVSALSSEFNRFFYWHLGNHQFASVPSLSTLSISTTGDLGQTSGRFISRTDPNRERWVASTRLSYPTRDALPVRNPALYTASFLKMLLELEGITLPEPESRPTPKNARMIWSIKSKTVEELVEATFEYSNNLIAELLLLHAAQKDSQEQLTAPQSATRMMRWLQQQIHTSWNGVVLKNGSGLSSENRMTAVAMASILQKAASARYQARSFKSLLAISGWKGWIENRLSEPPIAFRVWAKTGSMDYVSGIAGYLTNRAQRRFAFAIFQTDPKRRALLDQSISLPRIQQLRSQAPDWRRKALMREDAWIRGWVNTNH